MVLTQHAAAAGQSVLIQIAGSNPGDPDGDLRGPEGEQADQVPRISRITASAFTESTALEGSSAKAGFPGPPARGPPADRGRGREIRFPKPPPAVPAARQGQ